MQVSSIKHLVLSGGGMLGISYIGLIKYLEENLQTSLQNNLLSINLIRYLYIVIFIKC